MISKTIIFDNELEFRKFVISNYEDINKIYMVKDINDNAIFFYGFSSDLLITAKILSIDNYLDYEKIYKDLSNELNFFLYIDDDTQKLKKRL